MNPLFNLVGGIALGALGVTLGKKHLPGAPAKASAAVRGAASRVGGAASRVGQEVRGATAFGLGAIEKGAGGLRQRIETEPEADATEAPKPKNRRTPRKVSAVKSGSTK